jgi:RNA polymerase sigma-70 factor (ECF subfamily)
MEANQPPSDAELMERTARGDREAFAVLIRRHQALVFSIAFRFLGDRPQAQDVSQEVFVRLWGAARRYRPESPLPAYLRTLTVNQCLDLMRKPRLVRLEDPDGRPSGDDPLAAAQGAELYEMLSQALRALPPAQRMAVVLFHLEGASLREVATALDLSEKAAESLLSRGRSALRRHLGPILDGTGGTRGTGDGRAASNGEWPPASVKAKPGRS